MTFISIDTGATFDSLVDFSKSSLLLSLGAIIFNPTAWNIVARNEYKNKTITRAFGWFPPGHDEQPQVPIIPYEYASKIALVLGGLGQLFVITSTWQLGITGTFLGDYFGILMDHRVTGYVRLSLSNVLNDPMYVGSTMSFIATSLWYALHPTALALSAPLSTLSIRSLSATRVPLQTLIYSKRAAEQKKGNKSM
ncbi:methylene-fatty-acyl-phospholipid synthase [Coprinopsis sp. MPI-PUGE-AT-0042]|nr:methylene-fatty-acyl-phospholipid synthase [Coprinopsis sp. MPI-PUGE-AT-0042]